MDSDNLLSRAHGHLASALQLLDDAAAPSDIGAHVDLALGRLSQVLRAAGQTGSHDAELRKMSRGSDATN